MRHATRWAKLGLVVAAVASVTAAERAEGQANPFSFGVTAGASKAIGDFGDGVDLGYHGGALIQWNGPALPFGVRLDGVYHRFSAKEDSDVKLNILAGTVNGIFNFPTAAGSPFVPYLIGGVGIYRLSVSCDDCDDFDSESKAGFNGGGGVTFPMSGFSAFIEARYHHILTDDEAAKMIPISFGITIRP